MLMEDLLKDRSTREITHLFEEKIVTQKVDTELYNCTLPMDPMGTPTKNTFPYYDSHRQGSTKRVAVAAPLPGNSSEKTLLAGNC